jgi:hypothetical protein
MQRDLDSVCLAPEGFAYLPRGEIRAVAERDQLMLRVAQRAQRDDEVEPSMSLIREVVRRGDLDLVREVDRALGEMVAELAACDANEPRQRLPAASIERRAVPKRTLERRRGHVLRVRAVTDAVGDVCVDPPDQRLGIREGVVPPHTAFSQTKST